MSLININDERFWKILFDEACVEGKQAEKIEKELEQIVVDDTESIFQQLDNEKVDFADCESRKDVMLARQWNNCIEICKGIIRKWLR